MNFFLLKEAFSQAVLFLVAAGYRQSISCTLTHSHTFTSHPFWRPISMCNNNSPNENRLYADAMQNEYSLVDSIFHINALYLTHSPMLMFSRSYVIILIIIIFFYSDPYLNMSQRYRFCILQFICLLILLEIFTIAWCGDGGVSLFVCFFWLFLFLVSFTFSRVHPQRFSIETINIFFVCTVFYSLSHSFSVIRRRMDVYIRICM